MKRTTACTLGILLLVLASCSSTRPAAAGPGSVEYFSHERLAEFTAPKDSVRVVDYGYHRQEVVVIKRTKDQATRTCWPCVIIFVAAAPLIFL